MTGVDGARLLCLSACPSPPVGTSPSPPPPAPHHAPPRAGSNAGSPQTKTGYVDLPQTKTGYVDLPQTKTGYVDLPQTKTGYVDLPYPFVFPPDVIWTQGNPGLGRRRSRHVERIL